MPTADHLDQIRQELRRSSHRWASRVQALDEQLEDQERDERHRALLEWRRQQALAGRKRASRLLDAIEQQGEALLSDAIRLPDDPAPYRGLLPFQTQHARFFFGRDADVERLLDRLAEQPLVAVVGPAGSGKSSLVQAGLLPALARGALLDSRSWHTLLLAPGRRPLRTLARQLVNLAPVARRQQAADELADRLAGQPSALRAAVRSFLADRPWPLLLVIDPLDELLAPRPAASPDHARPFLANLADAVQHGEGRIRVVLTMRSELLARYHRQPALGQLLEGRQLLLGPMDEAAQRQAIIQPAHEVGALLEPGLAELILRDAQALSDPLPSLQHALHELWLARQGVWLTQESYLRVGGVAGAIQHRAELTYGSLSEPQQAAARTVFVRLASLDEDGMIPTGCVERRSLHAAGVDPDQVDAVLRAFSAPEAGMIMADDQQVALVQEVVIRRWGRLQEWLEAQQEAGRIHRYLGEAARRWQQAQRDRDLLLRDGRLEEAEQWAETYGDDLTPLEQEFLSTSILVRNRAIAEEQARHQQEVEAARRQASEADALRQQAEQRAEAQAAVAAAASTRARRRLVAMIVLALVAIAAGAAIAWGWQTVQQSQLAQQVAQATAEAAAWVPQTAQAEAQRYAGLAATREVEATTAAALAATWQAQAQANEQLAATRAAEAVLSRAEVERQARRAQAVDLATQAQVALRSGEDPSLSQPLLLARQAVETTWQPDGYVVPEASSALLAAVRAASPWRRTLTGHTGFVLSAAFSPCPNLAASDGRCPAGRVLTAGVDRTVRLWDVASGQELLRLMGHRSAVNSVAFSPCVSTAETTNGRCPAERVVTASSDGTARIWLLTSEPAGDVVRSQQLAVLRGHRGWVNQAAFDSQGSQVVTAGDDGTARIWDAETGRQIQVLTGHEGRVLSASFSPDDARVLTAGEDGTARLWDAASGQQVGQLAGHEAAVLAAAFSPDGTRVATAGEDGTVRVWRVEDGQELLQLAGHQAAVHSVAFSPCAGPAEESGARCAGSRLLTASTDGTARVWDAATGQELLRLAGHSGPVNAAAFSSCLSPPEASGGRCTAGQIVTAGDDGTARVWDGDANRRLPQLSGHSGWVTAASFGPCISPAARSDGVCTARLIVTASWDRTARIWLLRRGAGGEVASVAEVLRLSGHDDAVNAASFSAAGDLVVTASADRTARIWSLAGGGAGDALSGTELLRLSGHSGRVSDAAFDAAAERVVTASWDGTARVWDAITGQELLRLEGHQGRVLSAAFNPDGDLVVTAGADRTARVWRLAAGRAEQVLELSGHTQEVNRAAFSPDGRRIVTASDDGTARIWLLRSDPAGEALTAEVLQVLEGHGAAVNFAVFDGEGRRVVTASGDVGRGNGAGDNTVRIWDAATGQELLRLDGHRDRVLAAGFSPDGAYVVSASADRTARIWPATGDGLMAVAQSLVQR